MAIIDADAHVVEADGTWDYLSASEQQYRPLRVAQVSPRLPIGSRSATC